MRKEGREGDKEWGRGRGKKMSEQGKRDKKGRDGGYGENGKRNQNQNQNVMFNVQSKTNWKSV